MRSRVWLFVLFLSLFSTSLGAIAQNSSRRPNPLKFSDPCEGVTQITIGAVGDFLIHAPLQKRAQIDGTFKNQWRAFGPYFKGAEIMYGNLEVPTARGLTGRGELKADPGLVFDDSVHTSYPMFNVHPQLLADIVESGFDVVSTANNHALDRGSRGLAMTIEELQRVGLQFTGTRSQANPREWYSVVRSGKFSTAWIACTWILNIADRNREVFHCERDRRELLNLISSLRDQVDAVIVTPHWGEEYENEPRSYQIRAAREYLETGAAVVLGAHPHALQPIETYVTRDGRETLIAYSLANFISFQPRLISRTTIVLFFGLSKNKDGKTFINGVRFIPAMMQNRTGKIGEIELLPIIKDKLYGQDGLSHILSLFPEENWLPYGSPIVTNPECLPKPR